MEKETKKNLICFIILGLMLSFGFNYMSTAFLTEELISNGGGFAYLLVSLLIINPLFFVVYSSILSKWIKKTWWSIPLVASFFHFSMLKFYSTTEGIFYVKTYIIIGYISMLASYYFRQRQNINSIS